MFHNTAALGDVSLKMAEYANRNTISQYMIIDLNVSNVMFNITEFLKFFSKAEMLHDICNLTYT